MTPTSHALASGLISVIFAYVTQSWLGTATCFVGGIFIDIDHVIDYWIARRRLFFSYQTLLRFCALDRDGKIYLLFHSYELHVLLWLNVVVQPLDYFWLGLAVGVSTHLLLDTIFNPLKPLAYFLCYRMQCGFSKECLFPKDYYQNPRKYQKIPI